jgi:hypothetical protein
MAFGVISVGWARSLSALRFNSIQARQFFPKWLYVRARNWISAIGADEMRIARELVPWGLNLAGTA